MSDGVFVYDAKTGALIWKSRGDGANVSTLAVAYSPNGHMLASGDSYGAVSLWNAATGALLRKVSTG